MKHPKSEDVYNVAMTFLNLAKAYPESPVDMGSGIVSTEEEKVGTCGSPACHAGWYLIGRMSNDEWDAMEVYGFRSGVALMSADLGLKKGSWLRAWAHDNPDIWGNVYGRRMFYSTKAFGKESVTLKDIGKHWLEVAGRLEELENSEGQR